MTRIMILMSLLRSIPGKKDYISCPGTTLGPPQELERFFCEKALDIGFVENRMDKWIDEWIGEWLDGFVVSF